jgi:magnesium chelatase subunit D
MTAAPAWSDAVTAAQLFAIDPAGTGGVLVRSRAGPVRDRWVTILRAALPISQPLKHLPLHIADGRLLGGLDLNATLLAGRPVAERGLLADAHGGVLMVAMAERLPSATAVHITAAMDARETIMERDGLSLRMPARFGVIALDEGLDDEFAPESLGDRLGFHVDLNEIPIREADDFAIDREEILAAGDRLSMLKTSAEQIEAMCTAAAALGIVSLRAPMLALRAACASAALSAHDAVDKDDIALAARLVLAPRALVFPQEQVPEHPEQPQERPPSEAADDDKSDTGNPDIDRALDEVILAAVQAALPPDVLAALRGPSMRRRGRSQGKAGALQKSNKRGRPGGVSHGELRGGAKLNVIETLRAAAPWQPLRRREAAATSEPSRPHILIRKDDFRVSRFKQRTDTTTIFVVDASGSAALHRLAEAKGAVELLLADCYIRRDQVALIAFRGSAAQLLLPPTRSLARAKRCLAGLPGGGGTPLAAGLDAAFALSDSIRRKGQTPTVIVLTDGRANIGRDGGQGRSRAEEDAISAARQLRAAGIAAVLVDTSPRPGISGETFAREMGARYLPLPHADAATLSKAVLASVS